MPAANASSPIRRAAFAVAGLLALGLGVRVVDHLFSGGLPAPMDFAAFWTAGQIGLAGGNVYDAAAVRDVQRGLGLNETAVMMWNPPWTLALVLPLGLLSFPTAYRCWVLLNIALTIASAEMLWRGLGGAKPTRGPTYLLTLFFAPTLALIFSGQLTTFVLVGLAGYLVLSKRHPYLAGAVGALTAIKPHMLVLFALWLALDAIRDRDGRKVLVGGIIALLLMSVPAIVVNSGTWAQYAAITTGASSEHHQHVSNWAPPLVGWWLRKATPGQPFWVQWLPLGLGVACFLVWWKMSRETPSVPWLVGVSLLIAPYGVWHHDLVLLLLPILATAVKLARQPTRAAILFGTVLFMFANAIMFAMILTKSPYEWFVWVVPAMLLGCAATERLAEARPHPSPLPLGAA
jgi:hypothetical protein